MTANISGIISPVITPIADDGSVALERVDNSVEFSINCGCNAVVASGTGSQETASLTPGERAALIRATIDAVDGRVPVIAGISYPAQPIVTELIEVAEQSGADFVIAMPPWGDVPSPEGILEYYQRIATESTLSVVVYNNPILSVNMEKETMRDIAAIDGVDHMKESVRDWQKIAWLLENVHQEGLADIYTTMDVLLPTLRAGGAGAFIPAPATVPAMALLEAFETGDQERAEKLQKAFISFPPDGTGGLIPTCKAAARAMNVDLGGPRPPFQGISTAGENAVQTWLDRYMSE